LVTKNSPSLYQSTFNYFHIIRDYLAVDMLNLKVLWSYFTHTPSSRPYRIRWGKEESIYLYI